MRTTLGTVYKALCTRKKSDLSSVFCGGRPGEDREEDFSSVLLGRRRGEDRKIRLLVSASWTTARRRPRRKTSRQFLVEDGRERISRDDLAAGS